MRRHFMLVSLTSPFAPKFNHLLPQRLRQALPHDSLQRRQRPDRSVPIVPS